MEITLEKTKNKFNLDIFVLKFKPKNPEETLLLKEFEEELEKDYKCPEWKESTLTVIY